MPPFSRVRAPPRSHRYEVIKVDERKFRERGCFFLFLVVPLIPFDDVRVRQGNTNRWYCEQSTENVKEFDSSSNWSTGDGCAWGWRR